MTLCGMNQEKLARTLLRVIGMLIRGEYDALSDFCHGKIPPVEGLEQEMERWPDLFIMPPSEGVRDLVRGCWGIEGRDPKQWALDVNLWTIGEGVSDLTLVVTVTDSSGEFYDIEVDGLDVL